jgi:4-amino-4-deoxy-L-arabinose transferase-like glycosyltransferase
VWLLILVVFSAALLPRLYGLGTFLTIDEVKWAEGAAQFLLAFRSGNLAQTYWHFHPGITITWGSSLAVWGLCRHAADLADCARAQVTNLDESVGWLRLSTVLLTSAGIAGVYALGRRLLDGRIALLTAILLAFDPFFIGHSRILNGDAGAAILMFLSLLAFLIYWLDQPATRRKWRYLLLSGTFAGLAVLTKLPAPIIALFIAGLGLAAMVADWRKVGAVAIRRWMAALAVWGGVALIIFVLLWPAMWVQPWATLRLIYLDAFEIGGAAAGHDTYFFGQVSADPGLWFYPYVIPFRLTPIVTVGFLATIGWLLLPPTYFGLRTGYFLVRHLPLRLIEYAARAALQTSRFILAISRLTYPEARLVVVSLVMLLYILFVIIFSSASPKKLDRYVIAVIPAIGLLAAAGYDYLFKLVYAVFRTKGRSQPVRVNAKYYYLLMGAVAGLQLFLAILAAPYYLTYYNPLLGGPERIATQAPVGWGEGLEQAAFYLNSIPNAELLEVSAWYSDIFQPYFVGQRASFSDDGRAQLAADYVVFYVNQIQRQKPYPGLVDYFRARPPEFVVGITTTGGVVSSTRPEEIEDAVHWVEVYQAPAARSASGAPKIDEVAQLLAYKLGQQPSTAGPNETGPPRLSPGEEAPVALFLRVLGPLPGGAAISLVLSRDGRQGEWQTTDIQGAWREGQVMTWSGQLKLPPALPPGEYQLVVTLQRADGSIVAELPLSEQDTVIVNDE